MHLSIHALKHTYSFTSNGNHTIVQQVMEYTVKFGLIGQLMDKMMIGAQFNKGINLFLQGLKTYAEKNEN